MFDLVKTKDEIVKVESLGREIWNECYSKIITKEQIDYMLDKFQSVEAIKKQLELGYQYYLIKEAGLQESIGYFGFCKEEDRLFLSKIYILKKYRGKGYLRESVSFIKKICENKIVLTVNKNNLNAKHAYKKLGFIQVDSVVSEIGDGFVMDDYIMELAVI